MPLHRVHWYMYAGRALSRMFHYCIYSITSSDISIFSLIIFATCNAFMCPMYEVASLDLAASFESYILKMFNSILITIFVYSIILLYIVLESHEMSFVLTWLVERLLFTC